ncbi:serine/threonine-protein kinase RsbW [Pseudooceanicola antarcticus]|uniref:ATP-binding protein n=1 Tax=Pseudooceanicola antarcticus TaxID=1247613 RepID=A0A285HNI6_9RHOB|nr:ATP-binding protein [Pseudooceanicola antarcticus]PJE27751.1 ATP-binding protein [Pseudooceanicola antarcticus]SNY37299.1 serine/threonine-protein kinase RsbW [Pseudooceanicola antarcticus]
MQTEAGRSLPEQALHRHTKDIRLTFPSSPLSVRRALQTIVADLQELELEERGSVELVLAEVLNNVVEHAYGADERGWISLECATERDGLHFRIRDEGRPMPDDTPPMGAPAPLPEVLDKLPEGGFGWFLIKDLSRDVHYSRLDDVNELTFRIKVDTSPRKN